VYDPISVEVNSKPRILFGVRRGRKLIQGVIDSEHGYDDNKCIQFVQGRGRSIVQVANLLWEEMEWWSHIIRASHSLRGDANISMMVSHYCRK
jgi:hypothetical protein